MSAVGPDFTRVPPPQTSGVNRAGVSPLRNPSGQSAGTARANPAQKSACDPRPPPRFGAGRALVLHVSDDFDAPLEEFAEYGPA